MTKYHKVDAKDNMVVNNKENEVAAVAERPKAPVVVKVQPTKKKKGLVTRMVHGIMGPEGFSRIGDYIKNDIVVPALKNILAESIKSGIDMALFPNGRNVNTRYSDPRKFTGPTTNYANVSSQVVVSKPNRVYQYVDEYPLPDRTSAAEVLDSLIGFASTYGNVSVADYYDMLKAPSVYTDHNFGWSHESIVRSAIVPIRGGYLIKFPPLEQIG